MLGESVSWTFRRALAAPSFPLPLVASPSMATFLQWRASLQLSELDGLLIFFFTLAADEAVFSPVDTEIDRRARAALRVFAKKTA
jgi:hypothetical protein